VFKPILALFALICAGVAYGQLRNPELGTLCGAFSAWLAIMFLTSPGRWLRAMGTAVRRARQHVDTTREQLSQSVAALGKRPATPP
jgi:hypothetical protein